MTVIRSLADELREKMRRNPGNEETETESQGQLNADKQIKTIKKKAGKPPPEKPPTELESLFAELTGYDLTGNEKLLIRLDSRMVFMLKQLKVTKGIDMNKLIAYSLEAFFKERPELIIYIKSSLQDIEL